MSATVSFSRRELRDLVASWLALGVAFALFFLGGGSAAASALTAGAVGPLVTALLVSLFTAGIGFLLHELGHKVVAVRYGQRAAFRADYGMLFLAIAAALAGFLFAAPGAVHHQGRITEREHGLIALAGPAVNLALAVCFLAVLVAGVAVGAPLAAGVGGLGVTVNLFLAAFNMLPVGALDGATVKSWSTPVWAVVFVVSVVLAVGAWLGGLGFGLL
ncbi:metalloprotease [Halobaculum sp. P14]|uniref:metalloprotease n=1 Tax=Halobaculum sp. P14 TaxID=3421638 RepID=UPI003EBFC6F9